MDDPSGIVIRRVYFVEMTMRAYRFLFALSILLVVLFSQNGWAQQTPAERTLFDEANHSRRDQGLSPLKWDEALAVAARRHAAEMAKHGSISHQFPGEPSLPGRATKAGAHYISLSENVAEAPKATEIHGMWMNSPHHRANLLDPDMNSMGVGVVSKNGQFYAVEDFSKAR